MLRALILRSSQRVFECRTEEGELKEVKALGLLLKEGNVVVGDYVMLAQDKAKEWVIKQVLPRKNEIFRVIPREGIKKVSAANCDLQIIVVSATQPLYKQGLVDRYLVRAHQWNLPTILVFNKMDQFDKQQTLLDLKEEEARIAELGVDCFEVSAVQGLNYSPQFLTKGFSDLKERLKGKTTLFQGQSGVGKSRLVSALANDKIELKGQALGKVNKGKHTTTWSEIIELEYFMLIDSPGIRSFSLEDIGRDELLEYFPDLQKVSCLCQFPNCQHEENSKGCAFYSKSFNRPHLLSRLESYRQIFREVASTPEWKKSFK